MKKTIYLAPAAEEVLLTGVYFVHRTCRPILRRDLKDGPLTRRVPGIKGG